jgi:hypothetical protein
MQRRSDGRVNPDQLFVIFLARSEKSNGVSHLRDIKPLVFIPGVDRWSKLTAGRSTGMRKRSRFSALRCSNRQYD